MVFRHPAFVLSGMVPRLLRRTYGDRSARSLLRRDPSRSIKKITLRQTWGDWGYYWKLITQIAARTDSDQLPETGSLLRRDLRLQ
jgi:hypothetical protein